ncbi:DUF1134 domain-containing protein [Sphingomonas sp. SUN039]|uniref:DUF1134 domain-containing protein n=1 Tax=Sphingomonas sp. SUN039 TaxID=2937787 RepID=UPI002164D3C9|nr:DUF1134 domain-containing protein [Sphingomonas sp. SUN039]UVO55052.1 DUF1134 domain-containing protein [Sphingomonas sp. SUN039]
MYRNLAGWLIAALAVIAAPAVAQVKTIDPNTAAAQNDVAPLPGERGTAVNPPATPTAPAPSQPTDMPLSTPPAVPSNMAAPPASTLATQKTPTYHKDDLIGAAEGVFGKGAAGLAGIIERILADQGEPNAYIAGREAALALVVGLRYGSGTMKHSVEGERPVYWTGPSIGFDAGGDATKVFTLVYNLYDSQDLYKRYPQAEGRAYFVGGFSATYLRRGSVVLIPVRLGVGARLGVNIGYMKFSEKSRWLPF